MDKVDDQNQTRETRISFGDDVEKGGEGELETQLPQQQQQQEPPPEYMEDWQQRTPEPYTTMEVDTSYLKKKTSPTCKRVEKVFSVTVMLVFVCVVWALMSLPTLCHFAVICNTNPPSTGGLQTLENLTNCSMHRYQCGICSQYLSSCSNSPRQLTNVAKNDTHEENLLKLFTLLSTQSSYCFVESETIKRFVCQYTYQPCDDMGSVYLPPRNTCEYLRDNACSSEWRTLANNPVFGSLLPSCDTLEYDTSTNSSATCNETNEVTPPTNSTPPTSVACTAYTGSVCAAHLQFCSSARVSVSDPASTESILGIVAGQLTAAVNSTCSQNAGAALEFLCLHFFKPCDSFGYVVKPNRTTCERLRDQLCPSTWNTYRSFLPECSDLDETPMQPVCNTTSATNATKPSNVAPTSQPTATPTMDCTNISDSPIILTLNLTCNEESGFEEVNGTCQPLCSRWKQFTQIDSNVIDGVILTCVLIGMIGSVAVLLFSVIRYERVLTFPTVFIVYLTIDLMILGVIVLVQYVDRFGLSCSSDDLLLNTFETPTKFCTASGFILYYVLIGITWFWFVHVASTFYKVMWPFHARNHENKLKYVHVVCLIGGIVMPLGPALGAHFTDGFVHNRFPPLLCVGSNENVNYYGIVLPICLAVAVGSTMLIIILHLLHQKQRLFKHRDNNTQNKYSFGLSAAEKKIILIFLYYIVLASTDLTAFTIGISFVEQYRSAINDHFICESVRTNLTATCPEDFHSFRTAESLSIITYCLLGLFPIVNLLFAVNVQEVKNKLNRWCSRVNSRSRTASTSLKTITPPDSPPFSLRRNKSYTLTKQPINTRQVGTVGKSGKFRTAATGTL